MIAEQHKHWLFVSVIVASVVGMFFVGPISQDPNYHQFADQRALGFIPNAGDVLSNLLFIVVGSLGLWHGFNKSLTGGLPSLHRIYIFLFVGVFLTGFGSAYYHWAPSNSTLVWDRLPMTIAFMALFAMIIGEQISKELALTLVGPLIMFGAFSVAYWHFTELKGQGDLRLYVLVQFLPLLLIPLLLLLFPSPFNSSRGIWLALGFYALSKLFEALDKIIFDYGFGISGHSIKHVVAAGGTGCILWALTSRQSK